jgi:hypothetical protein
MALRPFIPADPTRIKIIDSNDLASSDKQNEGRG